MGQIFLAKVQAWLADKNSNAEVEVKTKKVRKAATASQSAKNRQLRKHRQPKRKRITQQTDELAALQKLGAVFKKSYYYLLMETYDGYAN